MEFDPDIDAIRRREKKKKLTLKINYNKNSQIVTISRELSGFLSISLFCVIRKN